VVAAAGAKAKRRCIEFFTAEIRNPRTRAYAGAVGKFFAWCERHHLTLESVEPVHVAAFIGLCQNSPHQEGGAGNVT
jgi:integrase/recombinase XerD